MAFSRRSDIANSAARRRAGVGQQCGNSPLGHHRPVFTLAGRSLVADSDAAGSSR